MAKKKPSKPNNLKAVMPAPDPNQPNQPEWQGPIQGDPRYARMSLEELLFLPSRPLNARLQAEVDRRVWPGFYDSSVFYKESFRRMHGPPLPRERTPRPGETGSSPWWGAIRALRTYPQRVAANPGLQTLLRSLQDEAGGGYHVPVLFGRPPVGRSHRSLNVTPRPRPDDHVVVPPAVMPSQRSNTILTPKRRTTIMK